jgi:hypothetical protein
MCGFFEEKNQRKAIVRLGEKDYGTVEVEKLLLLNSFAKSVGYSDDQLPYRDISAPSVSKEPSDTEYIGFSYKLRRTHIVSNPAQATTDYNSDDNEEEEEEDAARESTNSFPENDNEQIDFDERDIDVELQDDEFVLAARNPGSENYQDQQIEELEQEEATRVSDQTNAAAIALEIIKLLPATNGKETTMDVFKRLTH